MGLFDKLFGKGQTNTSKSPKQGSDARPESMDVGSVTEAMSQPGSKASIEKMLAMAETAMESGNYEQAVENYRSILKLEPNKVAQYNLGSLYAQGKGVKQDYMEGAYWFRQAELAGEEQAGKLCAKCIFDFTHQDFKEKSPEQLYTDMVCLINRVYSDAIDVNLEACRKLYAIAVNHLKKKEYTAAAKLLRAAAEFGQDGYSQNYLAVLYNTGAGLEKNDLASLYWFDKAVDNGAADVAQKDRDGILHAYKTNFSATDFCKEMLTLSRWCSQGTKEIPKDEKKAALWREIGESAAKDHP